MDSVSSDDEIDWMFDKSNQTPVKQLEEATSTEKSTPSAWILSRSGNTPDTPYNLKSNTVSSLKDQRTEPGKRGRKSLTSMFPNIVPTAKDFIEEHGYQADSRRRCDTARSSGVTLDQIKNKLVDKIPGLKERGIHKTTVHHMLAPPDKRLKSSSTVYKQEIDAIIRVDVLHYVLHLEMGKKLQIIWLEPKSDLYVKKKIIDTVARERVLSGSTIEKDAIVKVLFRTKYYNARIVSTDGTKKNISNDEGEVDNEPIAKKSKHDKHYAELEGNASDSDDEPLSKLKISNNGETGGCENFIPQQQRQIGQLSPTQENTNTSVFAEQIISAQEQNVNNESGKLVLNSCLSSYTDNKTTLKDSTNVSISAINSSNTTDENTITTVVAEQIISAQEQNVNNKGEELVLNSCLTTDTDKVYTTLKDFTNVSKSVSNSSDTTLKTPLKPLISLFPNFDEDPSFYGLQDHAQSALDHDYHVQVVAEPYENMNFFQSSMDSCTYTSKEQEIIQDPMPNLTCQTLQPPDQEFSKHQTLSEQLDFIEKQNGTILEAQNIAFEQISNISISMDTVQSNLQYLINLIKCRSTVKSSNKQTPVTPRGDSVHLEKTLDINCQIPVVVRSTINPENIRIGNSNFEMSYDKYCKILQRNSNLPTTFAVKLLSVLFTDNELFERNVTGRVIHDNVQRSKLNPIKLDAIENQLRLQFPQFMDSKENNDKIWIAINGKCRKTTAKLNKTVFSDPI